MTSRVALYLNFPICARRMRKMHPLAPRDCDCVIELRGPALRGMRGLAPNAFGDFFFPQSYNNNVCIVNAPFDVTPR